jgi:hypothetical protein
MLANDARCTLEIKLRIAMAKTASNKKTVDIESRWVYIFQWLIYTQSF